MSRLRIEALVGAIAEMAQRSRRWLPLPLHSQMPVEQQERVFGIAPLGVHKAFWTLLGSLSRRF